ncbi:MAG: hypothetical protein CMD99_07210 [Gammaproteobacteria bacterium]|nr:hypothetical protein [Gammaproteobacteria bacterium]|tara:strand:- start:232 stop:1323 length:1092 start_codon:yes stop_codon:yes gene_type:complete
MEYHNGGVIAEAGSNHNGSLNDAKKLIDIAKSASASSVKFQFIFSEGLYLPKYLIDGSYYDSEVYAQRRSEEFGDEQWEEIWRYAALREIDISASVFCDRGISLLKRLGAGYVKIASTDLTNHLLIEKVCKEFSTVLLSTGMASLAEIANAVSVAKAANQKIDLKLLHCVSMYPCAFEESKISRISALKSAFGLDVGYSDHTIDERSAILAWTAGARFFEKHFTFDKTLAGFDHAHAQSPEELNNYVQTVALCEEALNWSEESLSSESGELKTKIRARRGIYASRDLEAGHRITEDDLLFVRPSSEYEGHDPRDLVGLLITEAAPQYSALGTGSNVSIVGSNCKEASAFWANEMKEKKMIGGE